MPVVVSTGIMVLHKFVLGKFFPVLWPTNAVLSFAVVAVCFGVAIFALDSTYKMFQDKIANKSWSERVTTVGVVTYAQLAFLAVTYLFMSVFDAV
jgi:hypothetical protein